jgi:hypothetical protein
MPPLYSRTGVFEIASPIKIEQILPHSFYLTSITKHRLSPCSWRITLSSTGKLSARIIKCSVQDCIRHYTQWPLLFKTVKNIQQTLLKLDLSTFSNEARHNSCRCSDSLKAGRSGVWITARARDFVFSAPIQTGPGVHPASCTVGTGSHSRG